VDALQGIFWLCSHCSTCKWPFSAANAQQRMPSYGQLLRIAHCSTSRWPPLAAIVVVCLLQGQPSSFDMGNWKMWLLPAFLSRMSSNCEQLCRRTCRSTRRWPYSAAVVLVFSSQGQPLFLAHIIISRCPSFAASEHVRVSHFQPFFRANFITSNFPAKAAKEHTSSNSLQEPNGRESNLSFNHSNMLILPPVAAIRQEPYVQQNKQFVTELKATPSN